MTRDEALDIAHRATAQTGVSPTRVERYEARLAIRDEALRIVDRVRTNDITPEEVREMRPVLETYRDLLAAGPVRAPTLHTLGHKLKQVLARILHQFAESWLRDFAPDSCSRPKA